MVFSIKKKNIKKHVFYKKKHGFSKKNMVLIKNHGFYKKKTMVIANPASRNIYNAETCYP